MTRADAIDDGAARSPQAASTARPAARRDILLLGLFYLLMHGGILLAPQAVFWDDWLLYRTAHEMIAETFRDASAVAPIAWLHYALLAAGMWSYKVLTLALWFGSGLLLNRILERTGLLPAGARLALVLLFLVLPFNAARVAAINFPYTLCVFLFFLAWALMDRWRIVALLLFAASFVTPSLLVFYALPVLDMAWRGGYLSRWSAPFRFLLQRLDFVLLPLVFYGWRMLTFRPGGTYTGYNSNYAFANVPNAWNAQRLDAMQLPQRMDVLLVAVLLPLAWLLLARLGPQLREDARVRPRRVLSWLALGVLAFVLGGFPYWILGYVPTFMEWPSRHQLLLPLGTATVLIALAWLLPPRARTAALALVIAASLSLGVTNAYEFRVDAQKQRRLVELLARDPAVARASLIVFDDRTGWLNAIDRNYRFYEWNGILEEAFGDEKRFGVGVAEAGEYLAGRYDTFIKAQYKAGQHQRNPAGGALLVVVTHAPVTSLRGTGTVWRWPPLPELSLETRQISPEMLASVRKN